MKRVPSLPTERRTFTPPARGSLTCGLLLTVLLCTCGPALEEHEETDDLGFRTEYTTSPETGQREGTARRYNRDGQLVTEENYAGGKLDGLRTAYYPDGKKELVENYRNGQFEGEYLTYDSLGNLRLRGLYADGKMARQWLRYYPSGEVREEVTFADNRENGPFREWYENGAPRYAGSYLNGKEEGLLYAFDEAGELAAIRNCEQAVCRTIWRPTDEAAAPGQAPDMTRPPAAGATK